MPIRSAFDLAVINGIYSQRFNADTTPLQAIIAVILQRALGCRINEIRLLTVGDLKELIKTKYISIRNTKRNRNQIKAIPNHSARQLNVLLTHCVGLDRRKKPSPHTVWGITG